MESTTRLKVLRLHSIDSAQPLRCRQEFRVDNKMVDTSSSSTLPTSVGTSSFVAGQRLDGQGHDRWDHDEVPDPVLRFTMIPSL